MSIRKIIRYGIIYGLYRTIVKIAGRSRKFYLRYFFIKLFISKKKDTSLIGCGQFGFSTISYFILKRNGNRFLDCFDIDLYHLNTTSDFWGYQKAENVNLLLNNPDCKFIFIASNHSTHTEYAIEALNAGKIVYVEKPVSVSYTQFASLLGVIRKGQYYNSLFVGYNRPFSKAVKTINSFINNSMLPITLNCFVIGHFIGPNHWYRKPEEGTRICGNVGHWIDLSIHFLNVRGKIPERFTIGIAYSKEEDIDDNISIAITTDYYDLINLIISSRAEPFEGINESIQFQSGEIIAKIDDFRQLQIWNGNKKFSFSYRPKDVGHEEAINQPFKLKQSRDFKEIEISTVIMIEITEMVKKRETTRTIRPFEIVKNLYDLKF